MFIAAGLGIALVSESRKSELPEEIQNDLEKVKDDIETKFANNDEG